MLILLLLYLAALGTVLARGIISRHIGYSRAFIGVTILIWTDLILTAQILSLFSAINNTLLYVALSFALAFMLSELLRRLPLTSEFGASDFPMPFEPRISRYLGWILLGTGLFVLLCNLLLAYGMLPANPDSTVYRFPRVYWYFGQGHLKHITNVADPRPLWYPFNGTLAMLPLVHFQAGPRMFSLPSLFSWMMITWTTYAFARDLGGSRLYAGATAWIIALTPNALIQALSTNDEIIAAMPMLAGLFFLHRWFRMRERLYLVLAALGICISAGTKLHVMFYWPHLLLISAALAWHYKLMIEEAKTWLDIKGVVVVSSLAVVCFVFVASFIIYNLVSAGQTTSWEFSNQLINKPFSLWVAVQTTVIFISQVLLTPLADLHVALDSTPRANHYVAFNRLVAPLFAWVDNGAAYTSAFYRFSGINSPSAVLFNEQTVFIGFTWLVALIASIVLCERRQEAGATWARWHLAAFPIWVLTFGGSTRYIEGFTVYLTYATIVAAPAFVFAFAPVSSKRLSRVRWGALAFVLAAHSFFALQVLFTSSPRNLISLMRAPSWPSSRGFDIDQSVIDNLKHAKQGIVSHTIAWGQPHWLFMAYNPVIKQFIASNPVGNPAPVGAPEDPVSLQLRYSRYVLMPRPDDNRMHVYSFPQVPTYGHSIPIRIPDKSSSGLTWLGDLRFAFGPEWVFAAGGSTSDKMKGRDKYIVQQFQELSDFGRDPEPVIAIPSTIYGLEPDDNLMFRYELRIDDKLIGSTDWAAAPNARFKATGLNGDNAVLKMLVRNDGAGGSVYSANIRVKSTKAFELAKPN